jgi:Domain of unknown function (DUF4123)
MTLWTSVGPPKLMSLNDGDHHYALIDAAQIDRFSAKLGGTRAVRAHEPLFGLPIAPANADATPHLLSVAGLDALRSLTGTWTDRHTSHGAIAWLISPLPHRELAARLRARLDARLPDRFDCVNRYFDGRVTPHLHDCLEASQREVFFSVCRQWWAVDHTHRWRSLPCTFLTLDTFEPPLELNDGQQAHLVDACYPHAVIEHFVQTDEDLLKEVPAAERYGFFRNTLRTAADYGIEGGATAILFCTLALTRGPNFHIEPEWQAALQEVRTGKSTLQQAVKAQHD